MDALARKLGLKTDPIIFFTSAGIMILFLVVLLIAPEPIGAAFGAGREWIVTNLGWFFILGVTSWVAFLLWVAISRFGAIRLGGNDAKPAYGNISWFTMLFAGGIGTVLMFWGVAEPISHFATPPRSGVEPFSVEAADDAMSFSIYHLGLHTWAIFAMPGLAFAYFIYRYKLPMRFSSVFYPLIGDRIYGPLGKSLDIFAILGTLFGVGVSVGLGTQQINAGLTELFGVPDAVITKVLIITVLTAVAVGSIVAGLDSGVKRLSNINIAMAVGLMIFVLFTGSTVFLLRAVVETFGLYITNLLPMAFWNDTLASYSSEGGTWGWQGSWTVFYWAWTVTWSPFIGIFVARISRGRTIREFVFGVLFAPSIFTLVWFAIFGWSAMEIDGIGSEAREAMGSQAGILSDAVGESIPLAMFTFFESFPGATLVQGLAVVIVAIFFATSSDSASLVVDMLCTGSEDPGPWHQRVFWGVSEGMLAAMLIVLAGDAGLTALQEVITVVGLPMFILVFIMMFALYRGLSHEEFSEVKVGSPPKPEELTQDS
ncbi:BCCT family transporter [Halomonas sp. HL-93]|uniref:BCCT family transporter n=1 Tax=Halomonas sp. HL-93 TaxID=1666906 RepID=UPI0006DB7E90|nr:BCCT family transporter [Halomonas sp. HL-93]KPQ28559.1 MAG: ectosine/glycine betaine/proline:Na+ symporter EctP [Halomonas sp. HL-93]SBR45338.1 choline/carnitine/betaine transport [Halomonas sp. HL-93]